jgi:DHA2 family multidrug resistance protein
MTSLNIPFQQYSQGLANALTQSVGRANSAGMAQGSIYNMLQLQAAMLGYQDVYKLLFWMAVGMVFLAFLLSSNKPGGDGKSDIAMH